MNTLKKMHIDEIIAGKRCLVVYGNKPEDIEEAEILRLVSPDCVKVWSWRALVRFADGVEYDYQLSQIMEVK